MELTSVMPSGDSFSELIQHIAQAVEQARSQVRQSVNQAMVASYWEIGRLIVEHEQQGQTRAEYGKQQLAELSKQLTAQLGKGFDASNLRNMRRFYLSFPIQETVSLELSWSHYVRLTKVENTQAQQWYMAEAIRQNWSVRALDRQISVLYYERLLSSQQKAAVEDEAAQHTNALAQSPQDFLRDPYILDFLNLQDKSY